MALPRLPIDFTLKTRSMGRMNTITRAEAVALYGNLTVLSEALGLTRAAIYFWKKDEPIPEWAYIKLRYVLKPEAFTRQGRINLRYPSPTPASRPRKKGQKKRVSRGRPSES